MLALGGCLACLLVALLAAQGLQGGVLRALLPLQKAAMPWLIPDQQVTMFTLESQREGLMLRTHTVTTRYIVVRGQAFAPGVEFESRTPARSSLLQAALVLMSGAAVLMGTAMRSQGPSTEGGMAQPLRSWFSLTNPLLRLGGSATLAVAVAVVVPVVTLAGAQWGVALAPFEELSLAAVLVGLSDFLLHGGGYAVGGALGLLPWLRWR